MNTWRRSRSPYPMLRSGDNGHLYSRSVVLRAYVINTGNGWTAIPGGLVRVAEAEGSVVSMQRGGHSKDAWVLWDSPVDTFSLLHPRNQPVALRRGSPDVPSSVADRVFWLGRYVERAENTARIARSMMSRVRRADPAELACLIRLHGCLRSRHSKLPKAKKRRPTPLEFEHELISVISDAKRTDSLAFILSEVSRVGNSVRERLSADMMILIGQLRNSLETERDTQIPRVSGDAHALPGVALRLLRDGARKYQSRLGLAVHEHRPASRARHLSHAACCARSHFRSVSRTGRFWNACSKLATAR